MGRPAGHRLEFDFQGVSTMATLQSTGAARQPDAWPSLPLKEWVETRDTLHMWTQIVGKIRLATMPRINHWWEVPLYVNARGLTTSPMPYGDGVFEILFDFIDHKLLIQTSAGATKTIPLAPRSVADFYSEVMTTLHSMGINTKIWPMPVEIPNPIRFDQDRIHASYDPEYANRFWRILVSTETVFTEFRARFLGKSSPVHFFWGSFDLALTRFSGRPAPERPGADPITREAYSHEVISAGFWPGTGDMDAVFYAYAAPEPPEFSKSTVQPRAALYSAQFSEFLLMYEDVRKASSPRTALLEFLQSTYEVGATLGAWDRSALERPGVA
jgi:hypothetical protein